MMYGEELDIKNSGEKCWKKTPFVSFPHIVIYQGGSSESLTALLSVPADSPDCALRDLDMA